LTDIPLEERRALLDAPSMPFDGMNEKGLAVGMAAVPPGDMPYDPWKTTLNELEVIREILDHAATVDEAIDILGSFNIDMGEVPIHYLIASASDGSALVEFYRGEMVVFRNESPCQVCNRSREFQDTMISPRRQIELRHRGPHQALTLILQLAKLPYLPHAHVGVTEKIRGLEIGESSVL
jgi:penicillin V acylase-like amidase (Ntn superfamily)